MSRVVRLDPFPSVFGVPVTEQVLFDKARLEITRGEKVAFIGPNGCGKSTLLRFIMGFNEPQHGDVTLGEHRVVANYFEQNQVSASAVWQKHGGPLVSASIPQETPRRSRGKRCRGGLFLVCPRCAMRGAGGGVGHGQDCAPDCGGGGRGVENE